LRLLSFCFTAPGIALAAQACPAPEAIPAATGPAPGQTLPSPLAQPGVSRLSPDEITASPALARIASQGATLYGLASHHGLRAVFATNGSQFRVFYLTPDSQAEIGGVMWDAEGRNVTREQVAPIAGTIPTIHWTPKATPASGSASPAVSDDVDPFGRLETASFGIEGRSGAPRVYMIVDPLCPFSTRAMATLQGYVSAGRLQLAIVPIAINDYENNGASTPAAIDMLSAGQQGMGNAWREISALGHARPGQVVADTAGAQLKLNLNAAHAIGVTGTPTLVWRDKTGVSHRSAGLPTDLEALLASLPS